MACYLLDTNHLSPLVTSGHRLISKVKHEVEMGAEFAITVPILAEFCPSKNYLRPKKMKENSSIEKALDNLEVFIDERKKYLKLLEDYYGMLEGFDKNHDYCIIAETESTCSETHYDRFRTISKLKVKDSDSIDTGFDSSNDLASFANVSNELETYV